MVNFDKEAAGWDNDPVRAVRAKAVAEGMMQSVPLNDNMVGFEYGCGTGVLSFNLHNHLKKIVMADSSEGMLEVLGKKIEQNDVRNMAPLKIDLLQEPIPVEKYDIVYSLMTLHHIPDTERIIEIFYEMIKPGGYLCIADLDEEDGSFHGKDFEGHNGFDREKLSALLVSKGFSRITVKTVFEMRKTVEENKERNYPVFLMTGKKQAVGTTCP